MRQGARKQRLLLGKGSRKIHLLGYIRDTGLFQIVRRSIDRRKVG